MKYSIIFNSAGLIFDIIGAILLFKYGLPAALEKNRDGFGIISGDGTTPYEIAMRKKTNCI